MTSENQLNKDNQRSDETGKVEFNLDDRKNPPISGELTISSGEYPHAILSLQCGIEAGFEIAGGRLRALIYRERRESPEIIDLGDAAELAAKETKSDEA